MNKNSKEIENLLNEIKILNSLSHPNMVKYNTCWLEYAELNEHTSYQKLLEGLANKKSDRQSPMSIKNFQDEVQQENINPTQYEQSYISSKNSGFSFIRSSKSKSTKKSCKNTRKQSLQLALIQSIPQPHVSNTANSSTFGLLPVMYIQMQLCEHSLAYYIKKRHSIDRAFAYQIMEQLIVGVGYIHSNKIVHRDLKPENILFAENNGHIFVKIGDFGLALHIDSKQKGDEKFSIPNVRVGTPSYIAPQFYSETMARISEQDLQKADIYSLAVIYYELLNKFDTSHERVDKLYLLKQGKVAGINQFKEQKRLIQELIRHNRPKAKDIPKMMHWKNLSQTIGKIKRKAYRERQVSKKDSVSTNCSSKSGYMILSGSLSEEKSMRNKQKNKNKSKKNNTEKKNQDKSQKQFNFAQQVQQAPQKILDQVSITKQNSDQVEEQIYKQNLEFIRRVSSSQTKANQTNAKGKKLMEIPLTAPRKVSQASEQNQQQSSQPSESIQIAS